MATIRRRNNYGCDVRVRCPLSINSASLSIDPIVGLYEANRLVVPTRTSLWEKIDYLTTKVLIWQPGGVGFFMDERYQ